MKTYYAKYKGKCYGFKRKIHRDSAVGAYGFESLSAYQALREFGYTDSCSRYVIDYIEVPAETLQARTFLSSVIK